MNRICRAKRSVSISQVYYGLRLRSGISGRNRLNIRDTRPDQLEFRRLVQCREQLPDDLIVDFRRTLQLERISDYNLQPALSQPEPAFRLRDLETERECLLDMPMLLLDLVA